MKEAVYRIKPFRLFRRGCVRQTLHSSENKKVTNKCRLDMKSKEAFKTLRSDLWGSKCSLLPLTSVPVQGTNCLEGCAVCCTKYLWDANLLLISYFESFVSKIFWGLMLTIFIGFFFCANFSVNTCFKSKSVISLVFHVVLLQSLLLHNFTVRS